MNTYEPAEFIRQLSANQLPDIAVPTILGLVKQDSGKPDSIQFSSSLSCERWLSIPTEMIETITHLRSVQCKDHQHPLVEIKLKRPNAARADLTFLMELVSQLQDLLRRLAMSQSKSLEGAVARDGDCYYKYVDGKVYICCGGLAGEPLVCGGLGLTR